ncbi:MAG: response regulator, partial [Oceanidesulfovibrio sp.]
MTTANHHHIPGDTHVHMDAPTPTILVVDDEILNATLLDAMLAEAEFKTIVATSGPEAREYVKSKRPDLILLDIMMPEEDGFETCRLLKQDPDTMDIPIIFISALSSVKSKVAGLELGAVDYISKPFETA